MKELSSSPGAYYKRKNHEGKSCMAITYVVNVPVTDVWARARAGEEKERLTQALLGDPVLAVDGDGSWVLGQVPDGYQGYMRRADLVPAPAARADTWATVVAREAAIRLVDDPSSSGMEIYLGTSLKLANGEAVSQVDKEVAVCLPDGKRGYIASDAVAVEPALPGQAKLAATALGYALLLLGAPYLWGGVTWAGVDCSGLVYVAYRTAGLLLPRDADQQYAHSQPVTGLPSPGELAFFATEEPGLASHVGLYLGQDRFVHASSRLGGVVVTSLNSPFYKEHFLGWRRC